MCIFSASKMHFLCEIVSSQDKGNDNDSLDLQLNSEFSAYLRDLDDTLSSRYPFREVSLPPHSAAE
jgi:hypothetical protein